MKEVKSGSGEPDSPLSAVASRDGWVVGDGSTRLVADGSTRRLVSDISRFFSKAQVVDQAAAAERSRLGRDLHDGILQGLTGIALQLHAASQLIANDPELARKRLEAIGELIATEQAELRAFIHRLTPIPGTALAAKSELAALLEKLRQRVEWQSGLRMRIDVDGPVGIPRKLGDEVYRIVQEALANIARHARAEQASVDVTLGFARAQIEVRDDGIGFPFRGRLGLHELRARNLGPASIRQRVEALHGELVVESTLSGSTLEIVLPVERSAPLWPSASPATRGD